MVLKYFGMNGFYTLTTAIFFSVPVFAQPEIQWQNCLGGNSNEDPYSAQQTIDGGYICAGLTYSNSGDVSGLHGSYDGWVVKLDDSGNLLWQKCLGGSNPDDITSIQQTTDGGFIAVGSTESDDGDVSGTHLNIYGNPSADYWIVKLDDSGNLLWQKCLGGSDVDRAYSVQQTDDKGFIVAGYSYSSDGDVSLNYPTPSGYPSTDYWIVKLDSSANIEWEKTLGGSLYDVAYSVRQSGDGGYIIAGKSSSDDIDISDHHGDPYINDAWVVKLDPTGNIMWEKSLGGNDEDGVSSIQQITDNGFIVAGTTFSNDGDVSGWHPGYDYYSDGYYTDSFPHSDAWIVKIDGSGNIEWQKCLGGSDDDNATFIQQTSDNGFVIAAGTSSNDGDVLGNHGWNDCWIVKLENTGDLEWQKCLGGSSYEYAACIDETTDEGFMVEGYSSYSNDGDVSGNHIADYWIVKLFPEAGNECSAPTSLLAVDITPTTATLQWSAIAGAVGYRIRDKAAGTAQWNFGYATNNEKLLSGLLPNTKYICKVRSVCSQAPEIYSDNSVEITFTTAPLKLDGLSGNEESFTEVYPNPVQTELMINLGVPVSEVSIQVFDLQRKMIDLPIAIQGTQAQINTTSLPNGFYTLQIINKENGMSEVKRFIKQE